MQSHLLHGYGDDGDDDVSGGVGGSHTMVVVMIVSVAPAPDQKGLQVYFHICNDCIEVIRETTRDERYSTVVSVVASLLHHVGGDGSVSGSHTRSRSRSSAAPYY